MQCAWFRKWLTLDAKKRFEMLTSTENTIQANEELEDDIDRYIPYDCWRLEKIQGRGANTEIPTDESLMREWRSLVESMQYECLFRRGQWLIPKFVGVGRRNRDRHTVCMHVARCCNIKDAEQMMRVWQAGQAQLQHYGDGFKHAKGWQDAVALEIDARVSDMPRVQKAEHTHLGTLEREALYHV